MPNVLLNTCLVDKDFSASPGDVIFMTDAEAAIFVESGEGQITSKDVTIKKNQPLNEIRTATDQTPTVKAIKKGR